MIATFISPETRERKKETKRTIEIEKFEMEPYVALRTREKLLPSFETINFTKC